MDKHIDDWGKQDWGMFFGVILIVGIIATVLTSGIVEVAMFAVAVGIAAVFGAGPDKVAKRWAQSIKTPWTLVALLTVLVLVLLYVAV